MTVDNYNFMILFNVLRLHAQNESSPSLYGTKLMLEPSASQRLVSAASTDRTRPLQQQQLTGKDVSRIWANEEIKLRNIHSEPNLVITHVACDACLFSRPTKKLDLLTRYLKHVACVQSEHCLFFGGAGEKRQSWHDGAVPRSRRRRCQPGGGSGGRGGGAGNS